MKYQLNSEKILFTQLGDEGVVYDTEKNEYVSLNETFFKILKGVEVGLEVDQIVHNLCNEYAISEKDCKREVENALLKLEEKKYVLK
ncbi:PqqD family protein [Emticicia soli]|uniref:PqqD family protein n=1 Tax=Emticicia soli TaxID=2027878 RepID=A0ABW5J3G4_9BACT